MEKQTTVVALWEKLQMIYEKKSSSSKIILIRQLFNMKMRETKPITSHVNTFSRVLIKLSSQGLNFEEEVKTLALLSSLPTSWEVFCTTVTNISTKRSDRSYQKSIKDSRWDSPSTTMSKHTSPREWLKGPAAIKAVWEGEMTDRGQSRQAERQTPIAHIAKRLATMFLTVGHWTKWAETKASSGTGSSDSNHASSCN